MFPFAGQSGVDSIGFPMRSMRFKNSTVYGYYSYLGRTLTTTATSRTVWTYSLWIKRCSNSVMPLFTAYVNASNYSDIYLDGNGALTSLNYVAGVFKANKRTSTNLPDVTAWYHVLVSVNGTTMNMYINGVLQTLFAANVNPDGSNWWFGASNTAHWIGYEPPSSYPDGYMADIVYVDGQALTPADFTDIDFSGKRVPKRWPTAGKTLGTYGFWLSFDQYDSATPAKLGYNDGTGTRGSGSSGGIGNWSPSTGVYTNGAANDSSFDVPIDYDDGLQGRGNYNNLSYTNVTNNVGIVHGGLVIYTPAESWQSATSIMAVTEGKWYWEFFSGSAPAGYIHLGVVHANNPGYNSAPNAYIGSHATGWAYVSSGTKINNGSASAYGNSFAPNDVISVFLDADNGKIYFAKNGVIQNSGNIVAGTGFAFSGMGSGPFFPGVSIWGYAGGNYYGHINFGQQPFWSTALWDIAKAAGYKTICTQNFPVPAVSRPDQYFDTKTWTGTGTNRDIAGLGFSPNLVWIKNRSHNVSNNIQDSVRGFGVSSFSNTTDVESTTGGDVTAFLSNGVTLGTSQDVNFSGNTYVGWFVKEGLIPGLDIITFTAPVSGSFTVAHNLGAKPDFIIVKSRSATGSWSCTWPNAMLATETVYFSTSSVYTIANSWLNTDANNIGMLTGVNAIGNATHVAYAFKSVPGMSKFGVFYGNNNSYGPFVYLGFKPKFIMLKFIDATSWWIIVDTVRNTNNTIGNIVYPNVSDAENFSSCLNVLSNGFKMITTAFNSTTGRIAYAAFADKPSKYTGAF